MNDDGVPILWKKSHRLSTHPQGSFNSAEGTMKDSLCRKALNTAAPAAGFLSSSDGSLYIPSFLEGF